MGGGTSYGAVELRRLDQKLEDAFQSRHGTKRGIELLSGVIANSALAPIHIPIVCDSSDPIQFGTNFPISME